MKLSWLPIAITTTLVVSCASRQTAFAPLPGGPAVAATREVPSTAVAPVSRASSAKPKNALIGRVAKVNAEGRFVVLSFPPGNMPGLEERLALYRNGAQVGEVKITGPQNDSDVVADLLAGEAAVQDEARNEQ